ncbi:MAG: hypothetical protein AAF830_11840 [Pseudomonadota bacterium]
MVWRIVGSLLGLAMIIVGLPLMVSPIPFGVILITLGVIILVGANPLAARLLKTLRQKYPWLNRFFSTAEDVLPEELAEPLRKTDDQDKPAQKSASGPMTRSSYPRYLR